MKAGAAFLTRIAVCSGLAFLLLAEAAPAQALFNTGEAAFSVPVTSLRDMPFRRVVRQQYDYSCGSAALATLLRHHYGRDVDEAEVFQAMYAAGDQEKIRRVGFSLLDMQRYVASLGFRADGYRKSLADLQKIQRPAIALVQVGQYRHFVVIKGIRGDRILVGDPNQGLKLYTFKEWGRIWKGVIFAIHAEPGEAAFNRREEWASLTFGPINRLDHRSVASFTLALPPIDQITAAGQVAGAAR